MRTCMARIERSHIDLRPGYNLTAWPDPQCSLKTTYGLTLASNFSTSRTFMPFRQSGHSLNGRWIRWFLLQWNCWFLYFFLFTIALLSAVRLSTILFSISDGFLQWNQATRAQFNFFIRGHPFISIPWRELDPEAVARGRSHRHHGTNRRTSRQEWKLRGQACGFKPESK